ncbi:MAG TPA: diguanylate cyclase, partial [Rubrivivax sp.]|nr:diguanylate cyclase [Rubrivivax sp.]
MGAVEMTFPAAPMIDHTELTPWGLLTTLADGVIVDANPCFAAWAGLSREALCAGLRWKQLLSPASRILYETHFVPRLELQGAVSEVALDLARSDGTRYPILATALRRGSGSSATVSITVFDATETRRFEQVLRTARNDAEAAAAALAATHKSLHTEHERLRVMLRSIADAVVTVDVEGCITSFSPTAEEVTGVPLEQAMGSPIASVGRLLAVGSRQPIDLAGVMSRLAGPVSSDMLLIRKDGTERYLEGTAAPLRDDALQVEGAVLVWRDMTQRRADIAARRFEAAHDALTQLLNRREFERRVALALAPTDEPRHAPDLLLHIDLDEFKLINDTAGPTAGDALLTQVADLLRAAVRQTDLLARLGGDEFGVLLPQCELAAGTAVADTLRRRIEDFRFQIGN